MDFMKLKATLSLDSSEYESGLDNAEGKTGKLKKGLLAFGKASAVAIGAAASAVGVLTKKSVDAYAEYEQLSGGVKKLFGEQASAEIMKYANEAYKTAGMSANQYMEQATSFSAALINSLGGDQMAAAKQTDVAMRAISDNFNTFGGDIQNVQNAFQGFAKQNYTMLDNLKLGYGGTKSEMERLIADANEYAKANGMAADLSIDSFSDIVTAIDLIQQKQGIAGTTAAEAARTIEGSLNMTKAAWQNLVAGFANPDADLGQLMDNLVVAIVGENEGEGLLNQILPAIQRAMEGIGQLLEKAAPILAEQLPPIINTMLPSLISAALSLVNGLISALPSILQVLVGQMPMIITTLVQAIVQALPMLAKVAPQLILTLAQGIGQSLPTLIPAMVEAVVMMVTTLAENAPMLVDAAIAIIEGLAEGLIAALPILIKSIPKIVVKIVSALISGAGKLLSAGITLMGNLAKGVVRGFASIPSKIIALAKKIPTAIKNGVGNLASIGRNMIDGLWNGIRAKFDNVVERLKEKARNLPKAVKKVLGISSPSKVFAEVGKWIPEGLALGIEKNVSAIYNASDTMADATMFTPSVSVPNVNNSGSGDIVINLNYSAGEDANELARDIARGINRYRMAGAI